ncbi:MAG TPA: hypothetical protein VNB59_05045 [Solirubrobacterales bacterium]|jgi:hypothetical protein|nr:hypothetical protein [Solirubrobacterales bacterium]
MRIRWISIFLAVAAAALAGLGCGGGSYGSESTGSGPQTASPSRADAVAVAREFLQAVSHRDAGGFCRLSLPDIHRQNFATANVPPAGSCPARAAAMFAAPRPDGSQPLWELLAGATLGPIDLHCKPGTEHCTRATIVVEDLPLRGGGTINAPLPLTLTAAGWRVGQR